MYKWVLDDFLVARTRPVRSVTTKTCFCIRNSNVWQKCSLLHSFARNTRMLCHCFTRKCSYRLSFFKFKFLVPPYALETSFYKDLQILHNFALLSNEIPQKNSDSYVYFLSHLVILKTKSELSSANTEDWGKQGNPNVCRCLFFSSRWNYVWIGKWRCKLPVEVEAWENNKTKTTKKSSL